MAVLHSEAEAPLAVAPSVEVPLEAVASVVAEAPLEAEAQAEDFKKIKKCGISALFYLHYNIKGVYLFAKEVFLWQNY